LYRADHDHHIGSGFRKSVGIHNDLIAARWDTIKAKIPELVRGGLSLERRPGRSNHNGSRRHPPAIRILNYPDKCSPGVLRLRRQGNQH
jgi:hypothetical protein